MALEQYLWTDTFAAEGDLSAKQYHCMEMSSAGVVDVCDAASDLVIGILQNKPNAAGVAATVAIMGLTKAVAGGEIAVGNLVGTHTDGTVVAKTTDKDLVIGIARTAGSAGAIVEIYLGLYACKASI